MFPFSFLQNVANCLQNYKKYTRKGNFSISFLTINIKKSKNPLFLSNYLMMWSFTNSIFLEVDFIILNSNCSILITSFNFGKLWYS